LFSYKEPKELQIKVNNSVATKHDFSTHEYQIFLSFPLRWYNTNFVSNYTEAARMLVLISLLKPQPLNLSGPCGRTSRPVRKCRGLLPAIR